MAAVPGTCLAAFDAMVKLGPGPTFFTIFAYKWTVDPSSILLDADSFELGGFEDRVGGLRHITYSIEGWWDSGANPYDPPLALQDGRILPGLMLFTKLVTSPFWSIPLSIISDVNHTADVHDRHLCSWKGFGKGTFLYPTGNV